MSIPERVDPVDRSARLLCAVASGKAFSRRIVTWAMPAVGAVIVTSVLSIPSAGVRLSRPWLVGLLLSCWIFLVVVWILSICVLVYSASRSGQLYMLRGARSTAVATVKPDARPRALSGDMRIDFLAAWPRGAGAGTELATWLREREHAAGHRVTGTTSKLMLEAYLAGGMVRDGRTRLGLTPIASRPRPGAGASG